MLETKKIGDNKVIVAYAPNEIFIRESGRANFGKEEFLLKITDNQITINEEVAAKYNLKIEKV